jgi:hypothetical protein
MKGVERTILAAGFILAFAAGLSLLFCVILVGGAVSKGYPVLQFVGYWPLFTVGLLVMSGLLLLGAPRLARAIGKKKTDEEHLGFSVKRMVAGDTRLQIWAPSARRHRSPRRSATL